MKCPKCGSDVPEGASFCINCGATVGGEDDKTLDETAAPEEKLIAPKPVEPESEPTESESEPTEPVPEKGEPERPAELAASEAPDELPEPDRTLEETPPEPAEPKPEPAKPGAGKRLADKTEKPYHDYRKPITAIIFIVVILCSIFACCVFCVLISSMQGYAF